MGSDRRWDLQKFKSWVVHERLYKEHYECLSFYSEIFRFFLPNVVWKIMGKSEYIPNFAREGSFQGVRKYRLVLLLQMEFGK